MQIFTLAGLIAAQTFDFGCFNEAIQKCFSNLNVSEGERCTHLKLNLMELTNSVEDESNFIKYKLNTDTGACAIKTFIYLL